MSVEGPCYTLLSLSDESKQYTEQKISEDLQSENIAIKKEALKELIRNTINGEKYQNILMTVIRFVMPSQDHTIKKLLHLFWEVAPKYSADGKLLHEMILVCDTYRRDLQHPNEYVRGCTLRFLCKLKEPELLEPLMPSIFQCLEHRHAYVRRNAVLAIFTIYKNFESLLPDAPDRILRFLEEEQDPSCKRNAFFMLLHVSQGTAVEYLSDSLDTVDSFNETLQLVIVQLIHKVFRSHPNECVRFIRCVFSLLHSTSSSVRYQAATTLLTLSSAPSAVRAAASCYVDLILKESDNNAKLVILNSLIALRFQHEKQLQFLVMDIIRILGSSDIDLRRKALTLTVELTTARTVDEVIGFLKKELIKVCNTLSVVNDKINTTEVSTANENSSSSAKQSTSEEDTYIFSLVQAIKDICLRFPSTISNILFTLCDLLTYNEMSDSRAALEICLYLRDVIFRYSQHKEVILEKLMQIFPNVVGSEVLRHLLWIFGEFCVTVQEITILMKKFREALGPLPLVQNELARLDDNVSQLYNGTDNLKSSDQYGAPGVLSEGEVEGISKSNVKRVTADGTYATQSALTLRSPKSTLLRDIKRPVIQNALFSNHPMTSVVLASSLVKLFCRYSSEVQKSNLKPEDISSKKNSFAAECMLIISSIIHLFKSGLLAHPVNPDVIDRMWTCLLVISEAQANLMEVLERLSQASLRELLEAQDLEQKTYSKQKDVLESEFNANASKCVDAPIEFSLLSNDADELEQVDEFALTLNQALGSTPKTGDAYSTSKLRKVIQLTGFSDPVYAEAFVNINQFDIALDVLLVNQTSDTLQNLNLELSTLGDLKLVEKPHPLTLAPLDFANIRASIKVSSTENGVIFGNIVYDVRGSAGESNCIVLADIHIDILEYIQPSTCSSAEFRQMWSEFEWENKVTVNTQLTDLSSYLSHIAKITNFRCLTPPEALRGDCNYLSATLYACSVFGEHVLANLCLEKTGDNQPIGGHVRIRAKTQGMAVTMGEKVSTSQKQWSDKSVSVDEGVPIGVASNKFLVPAI